jgi:cold shock CspA family protein
MQGKITYWNLNRGYGFIRRDEGNDTYDTFVHVSALSDGRESLNVGDVVSFEIASDLRTKKTCAAQVRVVG